MSWTEERIDHLKRLWEKGMTASQIAEELGGVSRNAVIGKAHRLDLQSRPSPVKANEPASPRKSAKPAPKKAEAPAEAADDILDLTAGMAVDDTPSSPDVVALTAPAAKKTSPKVAAPKGERVLAPVASASAEMTPKTPKAAAPKPVTSDVEDVPPRSREIPLTHLNTPYAPPASAPTGAQLRSIGPGGFLRQGPGDQLPPAQPAPPRRLVPAKPSPDIAGKTTLLDLSERICKWPLGHPGEPDFHFCGDAVNPGFPYCVKHCGHAYQAQMPRRDRRMPPPIQFGGAKR